jgi:lipid-A-disaccharide synthase
MPKTRLFISTGEVSGDLQGSLLVTALQTEAAQQGLELEIIALGGQRMAAAGATLLADTTAISSVGLIEALGFVLPTLKIRQRVRQYLRQNPPDAVVLIDYIGVNVELGTFVHSQLNVPITYYIAPQEWVWSHSLKTTHQIAKISTQLLAIFPEEATYYAKHGAQVTWVGHPLVDRMVDAPKRDVARQSLRLAPEQLVVTLMPASRKQELKTLVPVVFAAAQQIQAAFPRVHFCISLAREAYRPLLSEAIQTYGLTASLTSDPLQALAAADLAITKSGTVNLETALLDVPQIVVYRVNPISVWLYQKLLKFTLEYASPVNLIHHQPVVPELLQDNANPDQIARTALDLLEQPALREKMLQGYAEMRSGLGEPGAIRRAAQAILAQVQPR